MKEFIAIKVPELFLASNFPEEFIKRMENMTGLPVIVLPLDFQLLTGKASEEELLRVKKTVDDFIERIK